jgi:hypothetical protein
MRKLNFYSFHRNILPYRFDNHNSLALYEILSKKYNVVRYELDGNDNFIFNNININHGSILIFEYDDTKEFKIYDFGDNPYLVKSLQNHPKFNLAIVGQYNPFIWGDNKIKSGIYPESIWDFGKLNYSVVEEHRIINKLNSKLYWRGSLYNNPNYGYGEYLNARKAIELLPNILQDNFYFGPSPLPFEQYINEVINFKLVLTIGGGGGYIGAKCGDICFRDIEMFGLGIPTIRPKYAIELHDPLIPDFHYISVDAEFDLKYKYINHEKIANDITKKYFKVINNNEYLNYISYNARKWYIKNISSTNITNNLIKLLEL